MIQVKRLRWIIHTVLLACLTTTPQLSRVKGLEDLVGSTHTPWRVWGYGRTDTKVFAHLCVGVSQFMPVPAYLVDPASNHMLVSKIKPCMSLYKLN